MKQRDYEAQALRRIKRFCDEADARILRTLTLTIQRLEREKLEHVLRKKRRTPLKKESMAVTGRRVR